MHYCSVCQKDFDCETPSVLTMGRSMTPRYICPECEALMDQALCERDVTLAREAIAALGARLAASDSDDAPVILAVTSHLDAAKVRANAIERGEYDFTLDENPTEEFELTEDLLETEEDRELDRRDEEEMEKVNKVMNYVTIGAFAAVGLFLIYRLLDWLVF